MIHGDYVDYVRTSGIDSVTEYELWWAIWSSINSVNFHELQWTLRRHADFVEHFVPLTFLGNHDVTRVASQIDEPRHRSHAVALLAFLPGVPSVYYGDEFGLEAVKEKPSGRGRRRTPGDAGDRWLFEHRTPRSSRSTGGRSGCAAATLAGRRGGHDRAGGERPSRRTIALPARRRFAHPGPESEQQALPATRRCADPGGRTGGRQEGRGSARLGDRRRLTGCGAPNARTGPAGGVWARSWRSQDAGATRRPRRP